MQLVQKFRSVFYFSCAAILKVVLPDYAVHIGTQILIIRGKMDQTAHLDNYLPKYEMCIPSQPPLGEDQIYDCTLLSPMYD
jgi:hypothetical protein